MAGHDGHWPATTTQGQGPGDDGGAELALWLATLWLVAVVWLGRAVRGLSENGG